MKNLVTSRSFANSPRWMRTTLIPVSGLLVIVGCGGAVTPGSAMQMAEGNGDGMAAPNGASGASTTGTMDMPVSNPTETPTSMEPTRGTPTTTEPTTGEPMDSPGSMDTTGENVPTDDVLPDDTGAEATEPTRGDDNPVPTDDGEEVPMDDPPAEDIAYTPVTFTEEQAQMFAEAGWTPLDIAPVDCTIMDIGAAAVAHPEDFSIARSASSTDHELILDLGGVVRRVDSYLTLPATDGHQHEIVFTDEALSAILQGVSVRVGTLQPPIGATDGHGHTVTVHSCGVYSAL